MRFFTIFLNMPWKHLGLYIFTSGFPGGSDGKESAGNAGDLGLIPGVGRSREEGRGKSLQYSCLEFPWAEEPGRLQSTGSQRVGHNWAIKHGTAHIYFKRETKAQSVLLVLSSLPVPSLFDTRDWFQWKAIFPWTRGCGMVSGWFKYIIFLVHFISVFMIIY